jgi:hypothetical protein
VSYDNHGTQRGDNSLNVGVGDFRGSNVHIGGDSRPTFTLDQIALERHQKFGGRIVRSQSLGTFGIVTGVASVIGLYFTLFPAFPQPKYSSWSTLFVFSLGLAMFCIVVPVVLRRKKFEPFLFHKYYLEAGSQGGVYLTSFTATCPWCGSQMHLRNIGPKEGPRDNLFICERNPGQHTINLDPTILSEIDEQ